METVSGGNASVISLDSESEVVIDTALNELETVSGNDAAILSWCGHWIEHCEDFAGFVKWTISIVIRYERLLPVRSMIMVFRHVLFLISWGIVCYLPQRIVIYCLGLKTT